MAFGSDIKFKLSGDTSSLERSFAKAEQIAERSGRQMEKSMRRGTGGRADGSTGLSQKQGRELDKQYKADVARVNAEKALKQFRRDEAYGEASSVGKMRMLQTELVTLAKARANAENGSTRQLQIQLQIEEKLAQLRRVQRSHQQASVGGGGGGGGSGGGMFGGLKSAMSGLMGVAGGAMLGNWIGGLVTGQFKRETHNAQVQAGARAEQAQSNYQTAGEMKGGYARVTAIDNQLKSVREQMKDSEDWVKTMTEGMGKIGDIFITDWQESVDEAKTKIEELKTQEVQLLNTRQLSTREYYLQSTQLGEQESATDKLNRLAKIGKANAMTRATAERQSAEGVETMTNLWGNSEQKATARIAAKAARGKEAQERQAMRQQRLETVQTLAEQAAQGRSFANGMRRPRSETERLAERAARNRERMRGAIVTGASGEVPFQLDAARKTEASVANRLQAATSMVKPPDVSDLTSLKVELKNSNVILKSIDESLKVVDVGISNFRRK